MWVQSQDLFCTFVVALSLELWEPHVYTLSNSFVPGRCSTWSENPMKFVLLVNLHATKLNGSVP